MQLEYFQMIDRVVEIDAGARRICAVCTFSQQSTVFEGHFPSYPLMPGVLLIECMAQTTGWLVSVLGGFAAMPISWSASRTLNSAARSFPAACSNLKATCSMRAPATPSANAPDATTARSSARRI